MSLVDTAGRATFTPGPWEKVALNGDGPFAIRMPFDGDGRTYYGVRQIHRSANATLIAAAPEMLEALYQYESDLKHPPEGDSLDRRLEHVRAVIAKAQKVAA